MILINSFSTDPENQYTIFFIYWSLKESFIKAIGLGLGYDLRKVR
jgi:phosphopantetheinyl transferase